MAEFVRSSGRSRSRRCGFAGVTVAVVLAGVGLVSCSSDGTEPTGEVEADGDGAVQLPQNPSLELVEVDGVWSVTNDGNVTMSSIEVRAGGDVLCAYDTLAPGDSVDCEAAAGGAALSVYGEGPQGQEVEGSAAT